MSEPSDQVDREQADPPLLTPFPPSTGGEETVQLTRLGVFECVFSLLQIVVVVVSWAVSCQPSSTVTAPATPYVGTFNAWTASSSALCQLTDPDVNGLGQSDYQREPYGTVCSYPHPPAAVGYTVTLVVSTLAVSTSSVPEHYSGLSGYHLGSGPIGPPGGAGERIVLDPSTVFDINIYPSTPTAEAGSGPPAGLIDAVVNSVEQHLPNGAADLLKTLDAAPTTVPATH